MYKRFLVLLPVLLTLSGCLELSIFSIVSHKPLISKSLRYEAVLGEYHLKLSTLDSSISDTPIKITFESNSYKLFNLYRGEWVENRNISINVEKIDRTFYVIQFRNNDGAIKLHGIRNVKGKLLYDGNADLYEYILLEFRSNGEKYLAIRSNSDGQNSLKSIWNFGREKAVYCKDKNSSISPTKICLLNTSDNMLKFVKDKIVENPIYINTTVSCNKSSLWQNDTNIVHFGRWSLNDSTFTILDIDYKNFLIERCRLKGVVDAQDELAKFVEEAFTALNINGKDLVKVYEAANGKLTAFEAQAWKDATEAYFLYKNLKKMVDAINTLLDSIMDAGTKASKKTQFVMLYKAAKCVSQNKYYVPNKGKCVFEAVTYENSIEEFGDSLKSSWEYAKDRRNRSYLGRIIDDMKRKLRQTVVQMFRTNKL